MKRLRQLAGWVIFLVITAVSPSGCGIAAPTGKWKPKDFYSDSKALALIDAVERDDTAGIDRVLHSGVDVNIRGKDGMTPLLWAMWSKSKVSFRHLLERGANPNLPVDVADPYDGHFSVMSKAAACENDSEWLKLALSHRGDANLLTRKGITVYSLEDNAKKPSEFIVISPTPIFEAVDSGRLENLELLIKAGANLNYQDGNGYTPAVCAAHNNNYEFVHRLLTAGADFRVKSKSDYDLACAVFRSGPPIVEKQSQWREKVIAFLTEKGVDMEAARKKVAEKGW